MSNSTARKRQLELEHRRHSRQLAGVGEQNPHARYYKGDGQALGFHLNNGPGRPAKRSHRQVKRGRVLRNLHNLYSRMLAAIEAVQS